MLQKEQHVRHNLGGRLPFRSDQAILNLLL
jgi:hypothetical protein